MLGTDPEFFVLNEVGKPVPAWRYFPSKDAKVYGPNRALKAFDGGHYFQSGSYFRDGYALEVNVAPEQCRGIFANAMRTILRTATAALPANYTLSSAAAMPIDLSDMHDAPPDCQVFGCKPAFNVYTGENSVPEIDAADHPYRYAGGHMHFSGPQSEEQMKSLVKLFDLFIGLPLAYLFDDEGNKQRRKYYGMAGECRMQKYPLDQTGVEYRVPSPQVWNDYKLAAMFFGVMRTLGWNVKLAEQWDKGWEDELQDQINNCNVSEKWLQTAPGFYTPELLHYIKKEGHFQELTLLTDNHEGHIGFSEWTGTIFPNTRYSMLGSHALPIALRKVA